MAENNKPTIDFGLADFELAVYRHNHQQAENLLIQLLRFMDNSNQFGTIFVDPDDITNNQAYFIGFIPFDNRKTLNQRLALYNRLAAAITALTCDPSYAMGNDLRLSFLFYKCHVSNIFSASTYRNMDHILITRGVCNNQYVLNIQSDDDFQQLLLFFSLESNIKIDHNLLFEYNAKTAGFFFLGLLYNLNCSFGSRVEQTRAELISAYHLLEKVPLEPIVYGLLPNPWMGCTYLQHPDKNHLKKALNKLCERWVMSQLNKKVRKKINQIPTTLAHPVKRIIMGMETYKSNHSMYRCYHSILQKLKTHYEIILVCNKTMIDNKAEEDGHQVIYLDDDVPTINSDLEKIINLQADMIIYPSLGMSRWAVFFANLRLAPVQVMFLGHPHASFSDNIDYILPLGIDQQENGFAPYCQETVIPVNFPQQGFTRRPDLPDKIPEKEQHDGIFRIAINSSLPKLSPSFLAACQSIKQRSNIAIEFHYFILQTRSAFGDNLGHFSLDQIGPTVIHTHKPYAQYLQDLANCDLALGTFPFGGVNTNIDLSMVGVPKLIMDCPTGDFFEKTDSDFFNHVNAPSCLRASSITDYINKALALINDKSLHDQSAAFMQSIDLSPFFQVREDCVNSAIEALNTISLSAQAKVQPLQHAKDA